MLLGAAALSVMSSVVIITVDCTDILFRYPFHRPRQCAGDTFMLDHPGQMALRMELSGNLSGLQLNSGMLPISRPLCGCEESGTENSVM